MLTLLYGPTVTSIQDYWKNHSFDYADLCQQWCLCILNILFRFVIAYLSRNKRLLISWLQSLTTLILEPPQMKSDTVFTFPPLFAMKWQDRMPSSFPFIKSPFGSFSLSAIKVISSAYLRLLIVLPAILIPDYDSSSLAFHMMCSAYKLNK